MKRLLCVFLFLLVFSNPTYADSFEYDDLGRLIKVTYSDGAVREYFYDAAGNRTSVVTSGAASHPDAVDDYPSVDEDNVLSFDPRANDSDPEGDPLSINAATSGAHGSVTFTVTSVSYTPTADFNGSDSFSYTISDGNGGTDTALINVTVLPTNDLPVAVNDATATSVDVPVTIDPRINDTDIDGDVLSIVAKTDGTNGTVTYSATEITYSPNSGWSGSDSFTYTVSDGNAGTNSAQVSVTVDASNTDPVAVDDSQSTNENVAITFDPRTNDTDSDGDPLSIIAKTDGTNGAVTFTSTSTTYTPNSGWTGTDSFTYTISDGNGGTDTATVTVTVNAANGAPTANNDMAGGSVYSSTNAFVLNNDSDPDGDTLTITTVTQPFNAIVTIKSNGTYLQILATDPGAGTFTYTISDGNGGTDTATVTFTAIGGGGGGGGFEN